MSSIRWVFLFSLFVLPALAGTVGTVVPLVGGAGDIVLDEARGRLYLVNGSQDRIEVYSILQRRFTDSIRTDSLPLSAAMSRSGQYLYVTSHNGSSLNVIDLDKLTSGVVNRIGLPAKPEGIAVGFDERVLITTIGTGPGNAANTLLVYDPAAAASNSIPVSDVLITPPAPQPPQLPALSGRIFLANRSQLLTTKDGSVIIGLNAYNQNSRVVFVYDVASSYVQASRYVGDISTVLSVSPDGKKFMVGLRLFETETLAVIAQMNATNAPFPLSLTLTAQGFTQVGQQFNLQQNQGGSVFAPDGSYVFGAFNIAPTQIPPARANITQFFISDPDNLLIQFGLQLPENLVGKMVVSSDGSAIYALSDSGFTVIPMTQFRTSPVAVPASTVAMLLNDQCGATAEQRSAKVDILNAGSGRLNATATLLSTATPAIPGLGGNTGPGGGIVGGTANNPAAQQAQMAPSVRTVQTPSGPQLQLDFNPAAGRTDGTVTHDFLLTSSEAINIPSMLRVFQNQREPEARADVIPVPVGYSPSESLMDMAQDTRRQLLYISNSGLNRVEVFDMRQRKLLDPIKVGQLPHSLAITPDGDTLYVANTGGESISVVDLTKMQATGNVKFPPIPFNGNLAILTPNVIAATRHGLEIVMSNGTLWKVIGDEVMPRSISPAIQTNTVPAPRQMTATPNGEYALLLDGQGYAYLYDSLSDEYVVRRQVVAAPIQGFYGPIAAGPGGRYYLVNGLVLNEALTPTQSAGTVPVTVPGRTGAAQSVVRPIAAVASAGNLTFARYALPAQASATAAVTELPVVELVDVNSGQTLRSSTGVESTATVITGNQRANIVGRAMAVDSAGTTAYVLTNSGLSIIPLDVTTPADRPLMNPNGIVNLASYQPKMSPNGLISIFGRNLGRTETASTTPLPSTLGGVCVTMNNQPLPLLMTSPTQINAQIPPESAASRFPIVIHSLEKKAASSAQSITLTKYTPAVFVGGDGQTAIYHMDGSPVTRQHQAKRDEQLVMYAVGLGPTKGGKVTGGIPSPSAPLAEIANVFVFFGDPRYKEAAIIVEWSGLAPGFIGVYQINVRVPGAHISSKDTPLLVTVRSGGVDSPSTAPVVPTIWVE